jgi:hypothetical protein
MNCRLFYRLFVFAALSASASVSAQNKVKVFVFAGDEKLLRQGSIDGAKQTDPAESFLLIGEALGTEMLRILPTPRTVRHARCLPNCSDRM